MHCSCLSKFKPPRRNGDDETWPRRLTVAAETVHERDGLQAESFRPSPLPPHAVMATGCRRMAESSPRAWKRRRPRRFLAASSDLRKNEVDKSMTTAALSMLCDWASDVSSLFLWQIISAAAAAMQAWAFVPVTCVVNWIAPTSVDEFSRTVQKYYCFVILEANRLTIFRGLVLNSRSCDLFFQFAARDDYSEQSSSVVTMTIWKASKRYEILIFIIFSWFTCTRTVKKAGLLRRISCQKHGTKTMLPSLTWPIWRMSVNVNLSHNSHHHHLVVIIRKRETNISDQSTGLLCLLPGTETLMMIIMNML